MNDEIQRDSGSVGLASARSNFRPRNAAATRAALIEAARPLFGEHGYEATTVSQIARAAGFSPNLITRYFGGKEGLFLAATETRLDMDRTLAGSVGGFGRRVADHLVERWEETGQGDPLLALLRSMSGPAALEALGEFLERESTKPLARWLVESGLGEREALDRATAIQSFILGAAVTRRVLHTGALETASWEELHDWLADTLQQMVADVPASVPSPGRLPIGGRS